ncbi:MAG: NAD(P)H-dependent flavin oxidoreductase, partial [Candidatus Velthaea sp.]
MWNDTALARRLGIEFPIIQGAFGGGLSSVDLVSTVSNAGGLGSFGAHQLAPAQITDLAAQLRAATAKPFALNLWVSDRDEGVDGMTASDYERYLAPLEPLFRELGVGAPPFPARFGERFAEQVEAVIASAPPVFSFVFGVPEASVVQRCRATGIVTVGTATTVDEAVALERAGVDAIVATGLEAGGHRASFLAAPETCLTGTFSLVQTVRAAVAVPVIAAGGIVNGRSVAAMLTLGADGVQIGTAFLACDESNAADEHRAALHSSKAWSTALTRAYTGRLARGMPNRTMATVEAAGVYAPYPVQSRITGALRAEAIRSGRAGEFIQLWAGQSARLLRHRRA